MSDVTHSSASVGTAQRRIVDHLKRKAPCTTAEVADALGVSGAAVRPQLAELEELGLVVSSPRAVLRRGRPPMVWQLTPAALDLFADRHGDLTVELIDALRTALGEEGLERVLEARDRAQRAALADAMSQFGELDERVAVLAEHRSAQGYMAEVVTDGADLLLVEHHCPVCVAAESCRNLCRSELELFQSALGPQADVERTQHLLAGDPRCVYRIRRRSETTP